MRAWALRGGVVASLIALAGGGFLQAATGEVAALLDEVAERNPEIQAARARARAAASSAPP